MSEKKEHEKIEKIRKRILKSGVPLEIEIGNILRKSGWLVVNQWPYIDSETQKIRPVDVLAMKLSLQPSLGVQLLIECKKGLKNDWVFHTQEREKEFLPSLVALVDLIKKIKGIPIGEKLKNLTARGIMPSSLYSLHAFDKAIKIGVFNVIPSSAGKDNFYEAIKQVTSSLESMNKTLKGGQAIVFPTIVFDGEMFEFYQENDETKILPINHLQFMSFAKKVPSGMTPCLVDVVRKTYFPQFVKLIERDFNTLIELAKFREKEGNP